MLKVYIFKMKTFIYKRMKKQEDIVCYFLHSNFPQMYMQALLGPAMAGWHTPFSQFTLETISVGLKENIVG